LLFIVIFGCFSQFNLCHTQISEPLHCSFL
jgi:hypothetical protein